MADITAAMVKDLRETTGAGMMDCKKALTETNGDMDAAVEALSVLTKKFFEIAFEASLTFVIVSPNILIYH